MMKKRCISPIFAILSFSAVLSMLITAAAAQTSSSPACSDFIDNDNDLYVDYPADAGCINATDTNESNVIDITPPALDTTGLKVIRTYVRPRIELAFTEPITLNSAELYAVNPETEEMMRLGMNPPPIPITITAQSIFVIVVPNISLPNGYYDLNVNVEDIVGNEALIKQKFLIDAPSTKIKIVEPRIGVSNGIVRNLTIETSRYNQPEPTDCKITTSPFVYDFASSALVPFELPVTKPSTSHTILNFFDKASFSQEATFYILCTDQTYNRVNRERFDIYMDTTAPSINRFDFVPAKVVEYPEFENKMWVILNITANEPVICRYSFNENKNYSLMTSFPGFDKENFHAYTKNNNSVKFYLPDNATASYDFYAQCEDRAGWNTPVMKKTLQVDLTAGVGISVSEPPRYTSNKTLTLKMTTDKRAICQAGKTSSEYTGMSTDTSAKRHAYSLGTFTDGTYTYSIKCRSQAVGALYVQDQEMTYTFTVDSTGPSQLNISGSTSTCFEDKFVFTPKLTFTGIDDESGISHYLYKLDAGSMLMINWTQNNGEINEIKEDSKGREFNLSQKTSYKITVKAVNGAGIAGSEKSVVIVYDPLNANCFEKDPPQIFLLKNESEGRTIVEINCIDKSGCDNESYYYGLCDTDGCPTTTKLAYPFIIDIFNTKYLTYNVSDMRGYSARGTEKIEVKQGNSCGNGMKDGSETGLDCGGSCEACGLNQTCSVDTDCSSNFCLNSTCAETGCDDSVKNGPYGNQETDIDCGGYCGATCELNSICNNDDDCMSGFCGPDDLCSIATCDDQYKNGNETGIDCGGDCDAICGDRDGDGIDDEWEEKYCDGDCNPDQDLDDDDLNNLKEFELRTNPSMKDTDGDGYSDGVEVKAGTDPLDPKDYPRSYAGILLVLFGLLFIAAGAGYLAYKKYYVGGRGKSFGTPPRGMSMTQAQMAMQSPEEKRRIAEQQMREAEQRRRMAEERQRKFAEIRSRISERRAKEGIRKADERKRLFERFGGAGAGTGISEGTKKEVREEIRAERPARQEPLRAASQAKQMTAAPETGGEWVSFDKLKGFMGIGKKPAENKAKMAAESMEAEGKKGAKERKTEGRMPLDKDDLTDEFSELEGLAKQPKGRAGKTEPDDLFKEMEEKVGESKTGGEKIIKKQEDLYKELEEVGSRPKKRK